MISREFTLTAPATLEVFEKEAAQKDGETTVRPVYTGICPSDSNYFFGTRPPEVLKLSYPLVPFHEAVVADGKGNLFAPVPNIPCYVLDKSRSKDACPACRVGGPGENYCPHAKFSSSNAPGFARTAFAYPNECLIPVQPGTPTEIAALAEPLSVARHNINSAVIRSNQRVAVIGDGPIGRAVSLLANYDQHVKKGENFILGVNQQKLQMAEAYATPVDVGNGGKKPFDVDVVFECVGGHYMDNHHSDVLRTGLEMLKPGGKLMLLGQSEALHTSSRELMRKGITVLPRVRSQISDFAYVSALMAEEAFCLQARRLIGETYVLEPDKRLAKTTLDTAFARSQGSKGKVLIDWRNLG